MLIYRNDLTGVEHLVMMKGQIDPGAPTYVRMHGLDLMVDLLGESHKSRHHGELQTAMQMIADQGTGVIVVLRESSVTSLSDIVLARQDAGAKSGGQELRDYGVGAQILNDLNVSEMILLSNSKPTIIGLEGYGLTIKDWKAIR